MAESYSVKAVLCAEDKNFSSMMKSCSSYAENLKNTLTSGIGFGAMAAIGSKAVSAVGSGLKSLTTGAISAGANFENAMSSVAAISGATGSDFDRLSEKAKQLGKITQYTASETASAMEYMAMAGWKTEDMLNGIEGVMDLAAASGEDSVYRRMVPQKLSKMVLQKKSPTLHILLMFWQQLRQIPIPMLLCWANLLNMRLP